MRTLLLCLVCFALLLSPGCRDREIQEIIDPSEEQYAYFPLQTGKYLIYTVDSIVYDFAPGGGTRLDSTRCWVKVVTSDTLRDNTGQLLYAVERFEKTSEHLPWAIKSVYTAQRNSNQAIQTENNLRFLKLVFPMNRRSSWNGNLWIDDAMEIEIAGERIRPFRNWHYEVDQIDVPANVGSFAFDATLLVTEADDANVFERRYSAARYAKNLGLVWREQWILDSQYCNQNPAPADCETRPWELKAEKGYILRQTIIDHN